VRPTGLVDPAVEAGTVCPAKGGNI